ncbi:MAG: type II toxin-antitoxin system RelE/ParE family toxin [Acidimicrobiales bacterium]
MTNLQAVYYRDRHGHEPVREFIDALDEHEQAALDNQIDRLNLLSDDVPHLPFPHSSQIEGELRELRCHYGRNLYRILYRRSDRLLILLHIFAKRSAKLPERDIQIARDRWNDFRTRMDAKPRVPPRAAGRDAP